MQIVTPYSRIPLRHFIAVVAFIMVSLVLGNYNIYGQCTVYNVSATGSTTICSGATGPTITLSNSETGVSYQLVRGSTNVGSAKAGTTGSALSWTNNTTAGTYTITASKSTAPTCSATMSGSVVVTVNALPTAPTVTGGSRCGAGTVSLGASSSTSGTFNLYTASTGGTPLLSSTTAATSYTFTTPSLSATTTYYVTFSNGTCESSPRKSVTATINTVPTVTSVTGGTTCGTGTVSLQASSSAAGTFKLYAASTGGSALSTSPSSQTSHTFTSPSITATKTYYITVTVAGCESTPRTSVVATVAPPQSFTVSGGGALTSQITSATINLSGSQSSVNYQLKLNGTNSGTAVAGNSSPLSWTVSTPGTYSITAQLGTCSVSMGSVSVTNGNVDDALEYTALKDLFLSTNNGTGWINKTNWPTSWPATATSAEFGTWFGVGVSEGDVTSLMLYSNNLSGTLPTSLGNLQALIYVNLQSNSLIGSLPSSLSNAHNLTSFIIQANQLSGPMPAWSGTDFPFLQILYLNNNQFTGTIPPSYASFPSMSQLFLYGNQLTGTIPPEFATMTWLQDFRPGGNPFTPGPIPSWLGQMTGLTTLLLGGCNFTGTIPSSLGNLPHLSYLSLNYNQLTGGIPASLANTPIATLDILNNQLNDLSVDLSGMTHLSYLGLSNNQFHGALPEWFGNLPALASLIMDNNQLTSLPSSFSNLSHLTYLYLQNNLLAGNFPDVSQMTNLYVVNISHNQFSGSLPASLSGRNLYLFDAGFNQFSGPFPSISNWTILTSLTITGNQFSGAFPSVTGLNALTFLEATSNKFTSFPTSVLNLPSVGYVSFENNRINTIDNLQTDVAANNIHPASSLYMFIDQNQLDFKTIGTISSLGFPVFAFPQHEINDVDTVSFTEWNQLAIPSRPRNTSTTITWFKKVDENWIDVTTQSADATLQTFLLSTSGQANTGQYYWSTTDTQFPDMIIKSKPIMAKMNSINGIGEFNNVMINKALYVATTPTSNYSLAVKGDMLLTKLNLKVPSSWPDYVFDKNYDLRSLDELSEYITQKGHLPGIPSAEEMEKKQVYSVAEMDASVLEKIEELTLYAIDLNEQLKEYSTSNKNAKNTNESFHSSLHLNYRKDKRLLPLGSWFKKRWADRENETSYSSFYSSPSIPTFEQAKVSDKVLIAPVKAVPANYKLVVGGYGIASGLDIKPVSQWPDYVFEESYQIPTLAELDVYIKENHHLPNLPSSQQMVESENYSISQMDAKLLEKTEELTLYTIQLKNKWEALRGNVSSSSLKRNRFSGFFTRLHRKRQVHKLNGEENFISLLNNPAGNSQSVPSTTLAESPLLDLTTLTINNSLCIACTGAMPTGYKLAVGGSILAAGVDIKAPQQWPDYVFESEYPLLSLDNVKEFISKNGHLPNIASAQQMAKDGHYDVAQMDAKLLEKIEELTLYLIKMNKRMFSIDENKSQPTRN